MSGKNLIRRKPNRLAAYEYAQPGGYFITICTANRQEILSRVAVGADSIRPPEIILSAIGRVVEQAIQEIPRHYPYVCLDHYVITPNHVHLLLRWCQYSQRMASVPTVVGQCKRFVSKKLGYSIWQKGFYDHIIRNDEDYQIRFQYIETNPVRWAEDEYYNG